MSDRRRELSFEQKMSDAEALMWNIEKDPWLNPNGAMVTILDQPLDVPLFTERIKQAVAQVPRLRERVVPGFARMAPPMWATDPEFDLDYHLRHIALPAPGTRRQLFDLVTRLYEDPFDRTRPLWIFYAIDGLGNGRGAVFSKQHHSITDGIGAIRLSELYIERERHAAPPEPVDLDLVLARALADDGDRPAADPSPMEAMRRSGGHVVRRQAGIARRALGEVALWGADPLQVLDAAESAAGTARAAFRQVVPSDRGEAGGSPLWTGRSRRRHLEALRVPLDDMKAAGKSLGGSVNDMFVTGAVLGALHYHADRGAFVEALNISFVVSTRRDRTIGGNSFTPTLVQVPGIHHDPEALLDAIRTRMAERRDAVANRGGGLAALAGLANLLPTSVVTRTARAQAARLDFATSNLRGAPFPTYMSGARVLQNVIMGPVAGTAMNITTLSSDGSLDIGLFMDPAAIAEPDALRRCMGRGYTDLLAAGGVVVDLDDTLEADPDPITGVRS